MTHKSITKAMSLVAIFGAMSMAAAPAQAQSTEEVLGALIGGTAGAVIGGQVDNRGSNSDGEIIGAVVGGSLGYIIGDGLDDDNDAKLRRRYNGQPGEYYRRDGRSYRRYRDNQHGYVYIHVSENDPYYYRDGRRKYHKSSSRYERRYHDSRQRNVSRNYR